MNPAEAEHPPAPTAAIKREDTLDREATVKMKHGRPRVMTPRAIPYAPKERSTRSEAADIVDRARNAILGLISQVADTGVHWKINNAQLFAKTFTFDELSPRRLKFQHWHLVRGD
jgi:hypothetical protein